MGEFGNVGADLLPNFATEVSLAVGRSAAGRRKGERGERIPQLSPFFAQLLVVINVGRDGGATALPLPLPLDCQHRNLIHSSRIA